MLVRMHELPGIAFVHFLLRMDVLIDEGLVNEVKLEGYRLAKAEGGRRPRELRGCELRNCLRIRVSRVTADDRAQEFTDAPRALGEPRRPRPAVTRIVQRCLEGRWLQIRHEATKFPPNVEALLLPGANIYVLHKIDVVTDGVVDTQQNGAA